MNIARRTSPWLLLLVLALPTESAARPFKKEIAKDVATSGREEIDRTLFGERQFNEIIDILKKKHLRPSLREARTWAAAANGALLASDLGLELIPTIWLQAQAATRARFRGDTEPLRCAGTTIPGLVLHKIPPRSTWREEEDAYAKRHPKLPSEPLVGALSAWEPPFARPQFRCVMDLALRGQSARTSPKSASNEARVKAPKTRARTLQGAQSKIWRRAIHYLLRSIDPHSKLTTPKAWRAVQRSFTSTIQLGFTFKWRHGIALVEKLLPHAPASTASLRPGDALRSIDGESVAGMKRARIIALLTRPVGAKVCLTFRGAISHQTYEITLTYLSTREADVSASPIKGLKGGVRVRVHKFADGTAARVRQALERFEIKHGALRGAVLDMRGNRGGIIPEAVALLELLRGGGLIGRIETVAGIEAIPLSRRKRRIFRTPLVVLVDRRCASACEFTAASLQDGQRALVVGERTWGKATLQEYIHLKSSNDRLMVTVALFHSPDGHAIQGNGITPDLLKAGQENKGAPVRGEAALAFHLQATLPEQTRRPHPQLRAIASCWHAALDRSPTLTIDPLVREATEALRCLLSTPGDWGRTLP